MDVSDEDLVRRYRSGDDSAFASLVDRHARGAVRFAAQILGDAHEAEDLAQEGFLKLVVAARNGAYDPERGCFAPFFFRTLRNLALDRVRSARTLGTLDEAVPAPAVGDAASSLEREEGRDRVRTILRRLPVNERAAIVLREFEGLSYREIAHVLDASLAQVKIWIFRARRRIGREWEAHAGDGRAAPGGVIDSRRSVS